MPRWPAVLVGLSTLCALAVAAHANSDEERPPLTLHAVGASLASVGDEHGRLHAPSPSQGPHAGSHGGTIVADAHGLLIAERNAGALIRADRHGRPVASLDLSPSLGELVRDADSGRVFLADRGADRVLEIAPGDAAGAGLGERSAAKIREPYGLALTPDAQILLVTSVADHELVAFDTADMSIRWRLPLAPEPRGVAVASSGDRALVGFLSTGALAEVRLGDAPTVSWHSLDPRDHVRILVEDDDDFGPFVESTIGEARGRFEVPTETGRRYARGVFSVGFIGHDIAVAPHHVSAPQLTRKAIDMLEEAAGDAYGGGASFISPIVNRLGIVHGLGAPVPGLGAEIDSAFLRVHQPRALAYDLERDTLYVAGYGDDRIVAIAAASQNVAYERWLTTVATHEDACGIDGLTVDGDKLWIHCELSRRVIGFDVDALDPKPTKVGRRTHTREAKDSIYGPQLAQSARSPEVEAGAELFRRANDHRLTANGELACAQCHPEGRADGLTWRLGHHILQTPMLAGRLTGTHPFKWDGQDKDLKASLRNTIGRLGGFPGELKRDELRALKAYLESLPAPRRPSEADPEAITRGRDLFVGEAGCASCHEGENLTDRTTHTLDTRLGEVDTPSLIGLAHSAPYYHDGSAIDLDALLANRSTIHEMTDTTGLSPAQIADLRTYLESL